MFPLSALDVLQDAFGASRLVPRGSSLYDELNDSYLSQINSDLQPLAIFVPSAVSDVALLVSLIKPFALAGSIEFAIRGRGQKPTPACNNINKGITIDLRHLSDVRVDEGGNTVTVGSGVRWGAVYAALQPFGLAVAGGHSALGGINGLALSGGLSYLSSREGFITDNVLDFEVVLASGEVVRANLHENPTLYRALRGGGNNFGIVTHATFRTFRQGPFWGGGVFYLPESFPSQIEAMVTELNQPNPSEETHLILSAGYSASLVGLGYGDILCQNQVYYTQQGDRPSFLSTFTDMRPQIDTLSTLRNLTLLEAAEERLGETTESQRVAYMNLHVKADVETINFAYTFYLSGIEPLKKLDNVTLSFTLQPYPVSVLAKTSFQGGNSLGLTPEDGAVVSILFLTWWVDQEDDDMIIGTLRDVLHKIDREAQTRGTAVRFQYMNYAWDFQDPISSYGQKNKLALQRASKRYDPNGLFQEGVPGGWKLFN